ncbi:cytochrome c oxidase accessory protein CcoG [Rubrivivax gelatinosus]|uniref:Cytochrome c oxidase accessory protein CcoG n=1 Tax=Rubrivivax gelatinosus TaxID=28068 RepID=A0ABS1E0E0_RUBGE|nr:cytochrome c oxidase accessory protein CcoG [Rubrivivax gelatinosus]MBK1715283.1 cytochrome c oxidase accessory protein CcoG [Rubrivivax gelatinosus]
MNTTHRVIPLQAAPAADPSPLLSPRLKIQPRTVHGRYTNWRWALVWLTQLVFYGLPWLPWNGRPAVLFSLETRRFYLFDLVLLPQDLVFLSLLLVISALLLFFVTAIAGRLWCGFACPQTVYTEMFLWLEARFEGDRPARLRLDAARWRAPKLLRRGGKHLAWVALALWTGISFVGWFTPLRDWLPALAGGELGWGVFWALFYGGFTYLNAGLLREQVCRHMCPYARFQGSMMDVDTRVVGYDARRGEARGRRARGSDPKALGLGDCVDCSLCVQVCPTGVDIRKGLQFDCISCGACIDACDKVMDKLGYARGLVRFATLRALAGDNGPAATRPRVRVYGLMLLAACTALAVGLADRAPFRVDVMRDRGVLAREAGPGWVENVYRLQVVNASEKTRQLQVRVLGLDGAEVLDGARFELPPAAERTLPLNVRAPAGDGGERVRPIRFEFSTADGSDAARVEEPSTFLMPR